jgi:hypothetical protein
MSNQTSTERLNRIADASKLRKSRMERWPKEIVGEVCALRAEGVPTSTIAAATGISAMSIYKWMAVGRVRNPQRKRRYTPAKQPLIKVFDVSKNHELISFRLQWRQLEIRFRS